MSDLPTPNILLSNRETSQLKFIQSALLSKGAEFNLEKHLNFTRITFDSSVDGRVPVEVVAESIVTINKFQVLKSLISEYQSKNFEIYALIGALMSVEADNEIKRIEKLIGMPEEIAPESFVAFRAEDLKDDWEELKVLASVLIKQCRNPEDIYRLIPYFLSPEDGLGVEVRKGPVAYCPEKIVIPEYTGDKNVDAVIEIVRRRPRQVVIKEPELLDERLLNTLRALGE